MLLCRSLDIYLLGSYLLSGPLQSQGSPWLPRLTAASSTHELAEPCLASPFFPVAWKLSPGNCRSQLICFPSLRDPSPHDAQCFESCCFLYFVWFSNCFRQKGEFNPYSSIRSRFYRMAFKTKLLYVSPLAPNLQIVSLATLFAKVRKILHDLITILTPVDSH